MNKLRAFLYENQEAYLKPLYNLVACDTQVVGHGIFGGHEKNGQVYLKSLFESMGAAEIVEDPMSETVLKKAVQMYQEGNLGHDQTDRYNLYAHFEGTSPKRLIFNGHVDTMPIGEADAWQYPPIHATLDGDRIYGLGVCDMKGGLTAAIMAVKLLKDAGRALPCHVTITSVVDEEGGGNGSIQAAMNGIKGDGLVVCEPTSGALILAHMGFVFFRVSIKGRANHSGAKWLGVSAIEKAMKMMAELEALENDWQLAYDHPLLPKPSMNVGTIHGGSAASTVAGSCTFEVCIHYHPNTMSHAQVEAAFMNAIDLDDPWLKANPPTVTMYQAGGAYEMPVDDAFVKCFQEAAKAVKGHEAVIEGSPAGCDSRIWQNIAGVPTIQFGPGNLAQCHAVNEYLSKSAYLESILVYASLIEQFGK
ncbi:MAG: acetylornithine deacetylase [Clostridiales bacterium]|nr:acetylornithine deacetylase [Clostridiales bacterium]